MSDEIKNTSEPEENDAPVEETVAEAEPVEETTESTTTEEPVVEESPTPTAIMAQEPHAVVATATEPEDDGGVSINPRGALAFVFLMLAFYVAYYLISWFEIFVLRGA